MAGIGSDGGGCVHCGSSSAPFTKNTQQTLNEFCKENKKAETRTTQGFKMAGGKRKKGKNCTFDLVDKFGQLRVMGDESIKNEITDEPPQNVLYYGWFFSSKVSLLIKGIADKYLLKSLKVPQFKRFLDDASSLHDGVKGLESIYRHPRATNKAPEDFQYHVTAKFMGREHHQEYESLAQCVTGKKFGIHLVSLFFTHKSFGIRVQLTPAQKMLFDERDGGSCATATDGFLLSQSTPSALPDDALNQLKLELEMMNDNDDDGLQFLPLVQIEANGITFDPLFATPSRAHITIGVAPKVRPVQTGNDVLKIIELEEMVKSSNMFATDYPLEDGGTLRQFGRKGDAFVIYPCHKIVAKAVFNHFI